MTKCTENQVVIDKEEPIFDKIIKKKNQTIEIIHIKRLNYNNLNFNRSRAINYPMSL